MGLNKIFPNLFLIGVYKGGTTSLHNYLIKHPMINQGLQKETHYLDKYVYEELSDKKNTPEDYKEFFEEANGKYYLDSSPSYFYGNSGLIDFIKLNSKNPKIILILRNPKERFISYYRYLYSKSIVSEKFSSFLNNCINNHTSDNLLRIGNYNNALKEGLYINYLKNWIEEFPNNLIILFSEDLKNNPQHEMDKLFSFLNLDPILYSKQDLIFSNKTINPKSKFTHNLLSSFNLRKKIHPKVYNTLIQTYRRINSQKDIRIINEETIFLDDFYKEANRKLFNYLQIEQRW